VDPDSNQFYSLNLLTYKIYIEKDVPASMRKKAGQTIRSINQLLKLDNPHWLFESQPARNYRYRKLHPYLLKKITCEFPLYLCNSDLSLAFAEVTEITIEVLLNQYQKEIVDLMVKAGGYHPKVDTLLEMKVSLLTSADEIVKNVLRRIFNYYEVKLKPKPGMKFVLRIFGYREYLARGHSMLMYDRIRLILRGVKSLRVMLTEIKKIDPNSELLLPIFERESEDVEKGIYSEIDWNKFLEAPLFLWYPPFKLPTYKTETIYNLQEYQKNLQVFNEKLYDEVSKPRVLNQKCMEEFKELRRDQYRKGIIHMNENNKLYSGECDWVFRLKIHGIENLFKLLEQADEKNQDDDPHKNAIYNGLLTPNYITKTLTNRPKEEHLTKSHKRKIKSQEKSKRSLTPKLIKSKKERESSYNPKFAPSTEGFFTRHTHHGLIQGANRFTQLAKYYGLNFTPYLVQINAYLYFGSKLLTDKAIAQTTQIPLSGSPKWNQWLEFPLKISQLPQESRICFDIAVFSSTGDSQIIASTTLQIFDCVGEFRQGMNSLNLWPFYRHEPRLTCAEEFWGLRYHQGHSTNEQMKEFVAKEFAGLYLSLDKFSSAMFWSNRDTEMMSLMCMPKLEEIEEEKQENKFNQIKNKVLNHMKHLKGVLLNDELEESEKTTVYERHDWHDKPTNEDLTKLQKLLNLNPLEMQELTEDEKYILLKCRNHYKSLSKALPIFLAAIDWSNPEQVGEVHKMLKEWAPLTPQEALPLLDALYADEAVRLYAVERISNFSDDELGLYMLELAQALMFENLHFSPLSEFLLERSLSNPFMVGHPFFWNLRSQLHLKPSCERFTLILEQMLMLCGQFREELFTDARVNDSIMQIAEDIQKSTTKGNTEMEDRKQELKSLLKNFKSKYQFSNTFCLAIDPRWEVEDFVYEKCNVMNSKKLPLWLVCQNSQKDAPPLKLLFKCGDDLRQDQLAMQLIMIMDKIWLDNGLDFRMKPYKVLASLDQVGMIEVVLNAETTSKIHKTFGGNFGALKESTIKDYLKKHNPDEKSENNAVENFIRSCAGYCVATYILGIGDRHSGNIMVTEKGHLFHIDFGHFLGNFKTKFGFKRERTAFVFTEEMAFVMGGRGAKDFDTFVEYCLRGYNLCRKNGHFLISIFMMMLSAGMPELSTAADLEYLVNQLSLDISEHEANAKFKKEISDSLNSNWRRVDNFIHTLKRD